MKRAAEDNLSVDHPSAEQLLAFGQGRLDADSHALIEQHVSDCDTCCRTLRTVPDDTLAVALRGGGAGHNETMAADPRADRAARTEEAGDLPQELIDHPRYRIVRPLGQGGMGVVYQAEHRLMDRQVALKVINRRLTSSTTAVERFRLEVRAAARLAHPSIVTAHDAEQAGDLHFLVMEYIEGVSLARQVEKRGPLSVLYACNFTTQVAKGLQHAFERGMVHRDIKPQNLMLNRKGQIKILDFGLARLAQAETTDSPPPQADDATASSGPSHGLTMDGVVLGTPDYIAPEQVSDSRTVDIRADIYSLGCTLYFLLTGRPPFPRGTAAQKIMAHVRQAPPPIAALRPELPADLVAVIERMMAKDPADRYQTPREVAQALEPFGKPGAAASTTPTTSVEEVGGSHGAAEHTPQPLDALLGGLPGWDGTPGDGSPGVVAGQGFDPLEVSSPLMLGQPGQAVGALGGNPWNTRSRRGGIAAAAREHQMTLLALGIGVPAMMLLACLAIFAGKKGLAALEGLNNGQAAITQSTSESKEPKNLDTARTAIVHAHGGQPIDGRDGLNSPAGHSPLIPGSEPSGMPVAARGATQKRVLLVIAHDGFWYADYEPVRRILEQGGVEVRVASSRAGMATPDPASGGTPVEADLLIQEARAGQFDAIVFTGGGMQEFIGIGPAGATTRSLVEEMAATNKWITSLCGGNAIPAKLGVLRGHKAAANQYIPQELQEGQGIDWVWNQPVVLSGRVLTGQSFEYAEQFAQELLRQLSTSA